MLKARIFTALELLLLLAIVFAVLLPFSPVNSQSVPSRDSGVFLYTGWRVLHGEIPYLQLWDHKPPVIYYLDALGLLLTPESIWGIWWGLVSLDFFCPVPDRRRQPDNGICAAASVCPAVVFLSG
ncbi:MAG: hypothetical protein NT121_25185 [Chloroflexi bacterium]|nr:hypothetical protein [Chloroflexota bacterium]